MRHQKDPEQGDRNGNDDESEGLVDEARSEMMYEGIASYLHELYNS